MYGTINNIHIEYMSSVPKDKTLYESVKRRVYRKIPKHSAYRSGILVKEYKEAYKKKHGSGSAYSGKKQEKKGLSRWYKEKWRTQDGKKTYSSKKDVFRPTKRITKETPKTFKELGKKKIQKAQREKQKTGRVKRY